MDVTYRRNPAIESSAMRAEALLFDPETNKFCLLNETAAFLWERLEEPATVPELAARLCESFEGVDAEQAEQDVRKILEQLDDLTLIATT